MEPLIQTRIDQLFWRILRPASFGLGCVYLILAIIHPFYLTGNPRLIMTVLAGVTAVTFYLLAYFFPQLEQRFTHGYSVASVISFLAFANAIVHLYLLQEAALTSNLIVVTLGLGVLYLSGKWFWATALIPFTLWLTIAWPYLEAGSEWTRLGFIYLFILALAGIVQASRQRTAVRYEELRRQDEQKQIQLQQRTQELEVAKQQAENADLAKTIFLSNISHELRTPLTIILGYLDLWQERHLEPDQVIPSELVPIQKSALHLQEIVNDLIEFASIEAGETRLSIDSFSIPTLVKQLEVRAQSWIAENHNTFQIKLDANVTTIKTDPNKLSRIIEHFLRNASKFTKQGHIQLQVSSQSATTYMFAVSDTGIGIPANQLTHLFTPFRQVDDSSTRQYEGTGLGLALAQRTAQLLGGDIMVNSEVGQGSTFTLIIPTEYNSNDKLR